MKLRLLWAMPMFLALFVTACSSPGQVAANPDLVPKPRLLSRSDQAALTRLDAAKKINAENVMVRRSDLSFVLRLARQERLKMSEARNLLKKK